MKDLAIRKLQEGTVLISLKLFIIMAIMRYNFLGEEEKIEFILNIFLT